MIISEKGTVKLEGDEPEVLAETMGVLGAVYQMLKRNHGEEFAKSRIQALGQYLVMREEGDVNLRRLETGSESRLN